MDLWNDPHTGVRRILLTVHTYRAWSPANRSGLILQYADSARRQRTNAAYSEGEGLAAGSITNHSLKCLSQLATESTRTTLLVSRPVDTLFRLRHARSFSSGLVKRPADSFSEKLGSGLDWRTLATACMPQCDNFDILRLTNKMIVERLLDDGQVDSADTVKLHTRCSASDSWLTSDQCERLLQLLTNCVWRSGAIDPPPRLRFPNVLRCESGLRSEATPSFPTAHLTEQIFSWNRLASSALRDRFEKHSLKLGVNLEGLFAIERKERHVCAFGQFRIDDDATTDHFSGCDLHHEILTRKAAVSLFQRSQRPRHDRSWADHVAPAFDPLPCLRSVVGQAR